MCNNELKIEVYDCQQRASIFKKVPASELRLDDDFMKHIPRTIEERHFKKLVESVIKNGLKDFWRPVCDPSLDDNGCICYEPGKMPAVGKSYNWWVENAKSFCTERGSRLGTKSEYVGFMATVIKDLIASGWNVSDAWYAVCNDSMELGHYRNSTNRKNEFEYTGSREICGWCDLANTSKILETEDCYTVNTYFSGGSCYHCSSIPLASITLVLCDRNREAIYSVGWIVVDSCPES